MPRKTPAKTIDAYLAKVSDDQRVALEKLRKTIKAAMPKAEECICYQIVDETSSGSVLIQNTASLIYCETLVIAKVLDVTIHVTANVYII